MTSLMLTISFILHVIVLIAIYYLFNQVIENKENHSQEINKLFEKHINEIKEENVRLEAILRENKEAKSRHMNHDKKTDDHVRKNEETQENLQGYSLNYPDIEAESKDDTIETSLQAKILQLHNQGLSVDYIAKKLNCGKTEAELIINLYDQKKQL